MTVELMPMTIYKVSTGEIVSTGAITLHDEFRDLQIASAISVWGDGYNISFVESDRNEHYIATLGEEIIRQDRPSIPYQVDKTTITSGTGDFLTITGLHNPCDVIVDDPDPTVETVVHVVEDGGFEFEAAVPGIYTIEIKHFPFKPMLLEITAT